MSPFIDGHCHLNSPELRENLEKHITEAASASVFRMMVVGSDLETSTEGLDIVRAYPDRGLYSAVGVHPHEAEGVADGLPVELTSLSDEAEVMAIGEIGLDYYYDHSPRKVQAEVMASQVEWARKSGLPVIFHVRDAFDDFFSLLKDVPVGSAGAVVHCFSGSWKEAVHCLDLGFYLGFGGMITFKKADEIRETFSKVPFDRIILETDSPWLAPVPYRGKTNTPAMMPLIYRAAADVRGVSIDLMADTVWKNGVEFYRWEDRDV